MDEGLERLQDLGIWLVRFILSSCAVVAVGVVLLGLLCAGKFFLRYLAQG